MQFNAFPAWYRFDATSGTCSGLLAALVDACVGSGIMGLILETYGEGNFPSGNPDDPEGGATYQALARAHQQGSPWSTAPRSSAAWSTTAPTRPAPGCRRSGRSARRT